MPVNGPPDLDKLVADFFKKIRALFQKKPPTWQPTESPRSHYSGSLAGLISLVVIALWVLSGFFIVNPAEEAVILRFGQYAEVVSPGLHWMARFIDTKYLVDVQKIYAFSLQGDFLTKSSEQDTANTQTVNITAAPVPADQSKNIVNVELNVQYRISDPRAYLFNVMEPDNTVQAVASGALSDVIGQMQLDDVLTTGREALSLGVLERMKIILTPYNTGIDIMAVTLRKVQAPDQVREAFNDVNRADQDKATYIQQAQAYASKVLPLAQGAAARILADANAYQQQVTLSAEAQVAKFQALLTAYKAAPVVTRERLYLETMQAIYANTNKIFIDGNSNNLMYLPIDKMMRQEETPPARLGAEANEN